MHPGCLDSWQQFDMITALISSADKKEIIRYSFITMYEMFLNFDFWCTTDRNVLKLAYLQQNYGMDMYLARTDKLINPA
jgi:hypothetical protein